MSSTSNPHNDLPFHSKPPIFHPQNQRSSKNQELCNQFKMGNCRYGGSCKYRHDRRVGMLEMENGDVMRSCKWALETCPFGKKCVFGHRVELGSCKRGFERSSHAKRTCAIKVTEGVRKTRLCHKWEIFGSCNYGGACHFAHGREELKQNGYVSSLGLEPYHTSSRKGSGSCYWQKRQGKKTLFKWNDIEKISRIYADWVDLAPVN